MFWSKRTNMERQSTRPRENYFDDIAHVNVRRPMYKANDSDDLHLMELISPVHELQHMLTERRRPMTHQHTPNKNLGNTPRNKPYTQAALQTLRELSLSGPKLNSIIFTTTTQARPKSAIGPRKFSAIEDMRRGAQTTRKPTKKHTLLTTPAHIHQNPPDFKPMKETHNSKVTTHRESHQHRRGSNNTIRVFVRETTEAEIRAPRARRAARIGLAINQSAVAPGMQTRRGDPAAAGANPKLEVQGRIRGGPHVQLREVHAQRLQGGGSAGAQEPGAGRRAAGSDGVQRDYSDVGNITAFMLHQMSFSGTTVGDSMFCC